MSPLLFSNPFILTNCWGEKSILVQKASNFVISNLLRCHWSFIKSHNSINFVYFSLNFCKRPQWYKKPKYRSGPPHGILSGSWAPVEKGLKCYIIIYLTSQVSRTQLCTSTFLTETAGTFYWVVDLESIWWFSRKCISANEVSHLIFLFSRAYKYRKSQIFQICLKVKDSIYHHGIFSNTYWGSTL